MLKHLPNILTFSRLFFTAGFLFILATVNHNNPQADDTHKMLWAFILFVVGGLTDIVDGPLARKLNATSAFGRFFDPLMDKFLIGGGFVMLAWIGRSLSGIAWWMVIVILAREALVTIIRTISETHGQAFGASWVGKLKMILQSFTLGTVVFQMAFLRDLTGWIRFRDFFIWLTVIFTAWSAVAYLVRFWQSQRPAAVSVVTPPPLEMK